MYDMETKMLLKHYLEQGVSKAELARQFQLSRRTIHYWIESGQLDRELTAGAGGYARRAPVAHKLDPYKGIIEARLEVYPKLTAQRLYEEVRAGGYAGSYGSVRDYVRQIRPRETADPVVRFETSPGASGPGRLRQLPAAVGAALRAAGGAGLLAAAVAVVFPATDDGGAVPRSGERVRAFRGCAGGAAVRPNAVGGGVRRPPGGRGPWR